MQLGLERLLREGGYGAYSTHFDAIATTAASRASRSRPPRA